MGDTVNVWVCVLGTPYFLVLEYPDAVHDPAESVAAFQRRDAAFPKKGGGLNGSAQHLLEVYKRAF